MNILFDNLESLIDAPNGIEKARELILQLAIQGKLTKQDAKDEPASDLLKKIKKEKEKLIAEGKIKKQNDFPPIKDEEKPFGLPKGWEFTRLESISELIHYGYTASADNSITDVRMLRITDIQDDKVFWNTVPGCQIEINNYKSYALNNNDLLIARTGGTIGKTYLVENLSVKAVFASYLIRVIPVKDIEPKYLKIYTGSQLYWIQLYQKSMGTGQPNVNGTSLKELIISIPPFNEQKRIVEKVNSLMALLDELAEKRERRNQKRIKLNNASLDKLLTSKDDKELKSNWKRIEENFSTLYSVPENVEKLKQAILQLAVQGKLVEQDLKDEPASELLKKIKKEKEKLIADGKIKKQKEPPSIKDEAKPFNLPKSWEWVRLTDISETITDGVHYAPKYTNKGIPCLSAKDIFDSKLNFQKCNYISEDEYQLIKEKFNLKAKSILITKSGSIGRTAIVNEISDIAFVESVGIINTFTDMICPEYIKIVLDHNFPEITGNHQYTRGLGVKHLTLTLLGSIITSVPPYNEQKRIVEKVNELMSLCNTLEEKQTKKEATAEKLVGAVVNAVANKTNKPMDDKADKKEKRTEIINNLIQQHSKALEKLS